MPVDKCAIAADAVGYLAESEGHWTRGYLVCDPNSSKYTSDEGLAESYWKNEDGSFNNEEWPVCAVGSIVRAMVKHGVSIVVQDDQEDYRYSDTYKELLLSLRDTVDEATGHIYGSVESFNDAEYTTREKVVDVMTDWKNKVCQ